MLKLNQKGFTVFEVVIVIVALVAVGAAGYSAYEARQDKTDYSANVPKKTPQAQSKPDDRQETTSVYSVKDLGIEFSLPSSLNDLTYKVVNLGGEQSVSSVAFSTKRLEAAGCSLDSAPLGHLTYTEGKGGTLIANARGSNLYYIGPKGSCNANSSLRDSQKLKEALRSAVSDYKGE